MDEISKFVKEWDYKYLGNNKAMRVLTNKEHWDLIKEIKKFCIPKSVVREKIEEYRNIACHKHPDSERIASICNEIIDWIETNG